MNAIHCGPYLRRKREPKTGLGPRAVAFRCGDCGDWHLRIDRSNR